MTVQLVPVPPDKLGAAWNFVSANIAAIAQATRQKLTVEDFGRLIADGSFTLWVVLEDGVLLAVVITEIIQYPQRRVCRVNACVGEHRQKWIHLLSEIEAWGRANGCAAMEILARKGWARVLPDYQMTHVFLERELTHA